MSSFILLSVLFSLVLHILLISLSDIICSSTILRNLSNVIFKMLIISDHDFTFSAQELFLLFALGEETEF